jgi:hypothetical protein
MTDQKMATFECITTQEIKLVDSKGKQRGMIKVFDESGIEFSFLNREGTIAGEIGLMDNGAPVFVLRGPGGQARIELTPDGEPSITLKHKDRYFQINLGLCPEGEPKRRKRK